MKVRLFFVRDDQEVAKIDIRYIHTCDQLVDILTKMLPAPRLNHLRENLSICGIIEKTLGLMGIVVFFLFHSIQVNWLHIPMVLADTLPQPSVKCSLCLPDETVSLHS